jgi:PAS domain S-box-containing protein
MDVQFQLDVSQRIAAIRRAVASRVDLVSILAAFYTSSSDVDQQEFRAFTSSMLTDRQGIHALAWIACVPESEREAFETKMRSRGNPDYQITERGPDRKLVRAGSRPYYFPVVFREPLPPNYPLFGFDLGSIPLFQKKFEYAMQSRSPTALVSTPLDEHDQNPDQLYVFEPVTSGGAITDAPSNKIDGFATCAFDVDQIVEGALQFFNAEAISIDVRNASVGAGNALIYAHRVVPQDLSDGTVPVTLSTHDASHPFQATIHVADHVWTIDCTPLPDYWAQQQTWGPLGILLAGLLGTVFLVGYLLLLTGRAARVEQLAFEQTAEIRSINDAVIDAMVILDPAGAIAHWNPAAERIFGYTSDEILGKLAYSMLVPPDQREKTQREHLAYTSSGHSYLAGQLIEREGMRKDGTIFPLEVSVAPIRLRGGWWAVVVGRDITVRKQLEHNLREHERKLQAILDQSFGFIGMMTPEGLLTEANQTALEFCGTSRDYVKNMPFWETPWWTHSPKLQERIQHAVQRAAKGEFIRMEVTHVAANGELHWIDFSLKPVKNEAGDVIFIIPEGRDISDRKKVEEALRAEQRSLRELLDLHEHDRQLVAFEIHDGLAQLLAGAVYKFQSVPLLQKEDSESAAAAFDDALELLREGMVETRRLISGLRPPILSELGVVAAIENMIEELNQREGPPIEWVQNVQFSRLAAPLESSIFRIVQECLTNARRYSKSSRIRVELTQTKDQLQIQIQDWGIGFDPTKVQGDHFGLRGIHERVRLLGGSVTIHAAPSQGVCIAIDLPMVMPTFSGESNSGSA